MAHTDFPLGHIKSEDCLHEFWISPSTTSHSFAALASNAKETAQYHGTFATGTNSNKMSLA
jgi:hypothetical protein